MAADDDTSLDALFDLLEDTGFTTPTIKSTEHPEGRAYLVPSPDAKTGVRLQALTSLGYKLHLNRKNPTKVAITEGEIARLQLDEQEQRDMAQQTLGEAYSEMVEDGVKWEIISRLSQYALVYFTSGKAQADDAARRGVFTGKAPAPANRSERRAGKKKGR